MAGDGDWDEGVDASGGAWLVETKQMLEWSDLPASLQTARRKDMDAAERGRRLDTRFDVGFLMSCSDGVVMEERSLWLSL